jgi:hypothetical protein
MPLTAAFRKLERALNPALKPLELGAGAYSTKRAALGERAALLTSLTVASELRVCGGGCP